MLVLVRTPNKWRRFVTYTIVLAAVAAAKPKTEDCEKSESNDENDHHGNPARVCLPPKIACQEKLNIFVRRYAHHVWFTGVAGAPLVVVACDPELVVVAAPFEPAVVVGAAPAAADVLASAAPVGSSFALAQ
jgi:hypothetical protein